jgi:hypothetical protein
MFMQDYEKYEELFLKDIAIEFEFSGNTELAFVQRLLLANSDLETWERLVQRGRNNPPVQVASG